MSPCPASCADLAAPSECDLTSCVEGCQCAPGFVMSEGSCVPYTQCGCTFLDRYFPVSVVGATCCSLHLCPVGGSSLLFVVARFTRSFSFLCVAAERAVRHGGLRSDLQVRCNGRNLPTQELPERPHLHHLRVQTGLLPRSDRNRKYITSYFEPVV